MHPTVDNDCLWCLTVQMPLSQADRVTTLATTASAYSGMYGVQGAGAGATDGLFQYRYEIRLADGDTEQRGTALATTPGGVSVLVEGGSERVEHHLKQQYFHSFHHNHKFRRFKGWTLSNKTVFQQYVQHHIFRFQQGECYGGQFSFILLVRFVRTSLIIWIIVSVLSNPTACDL